MKKFDPDQYCLDRLIKVAPEICKIEPFKSEFEWHHDKYGPNVHCIYEDVLRPYFLSLLDKSGFVSRKALKKIAELIDELLQHEDFDVMCIAKIGFLEGLLHDLYGQGRITLIEKYLLPHSVKVAKELAKTSIYKFDSSVWTGCE